MLKVLNMQHLEKNCPSEVICGHASGRETVARVWASVILFMPSRGIRTLLKNNGKPAFSFYSFSRNLTW